MTTPSSNELMPWRDDQYASSLFKKAFADSIAKFQEEVQTHHDESLKYFHDLRQLRTHKDDVFAGGKNAIGNDSPSAAYQGAFTEIGPKNSGNHPSQLSTYPTVPTPAPPPALTATFPHDAQPSSLDDGEVPPNSLHAARAIELWEAFVYTYAFCDVDELPVLQEELWDLWELQPCWLRQRRRLKNLSQTGPVQHGLHTTTTLQRGATRAGDRVLASGWSKNLVMEPSSGKRITWVLLGVTLIVYDMVMIPMAPIVDSGSAALELISLLTFWYWFLDLPLNFFVGFLDNGVVEMRPQKIAVRYAKSWFVFDFFLVAFDILLFVVENILDADMGAAGAVSSVRTARIGRLLRIMRGFRLLRLVKLGTMFSFILDIVNSEYWMLCFKLCAHLCFILGANHYVACGWFSLGKEIYLGTFGRDMPSWIAKVGIENSAGYIQYLMSLHWSVTQFTPATNNINPTCALERAYAILIVLFAMIMFSSFVSSVTNTVNELRRINLERTHEMARLRDFISKRQISQDLTMRIWNFFRQNFQKRRCSVLEKDIKFLVEVPESIIADLHEEMYMPVFRAHGALHSFKGIDAVLTSTICRTCFSDLYDIPKKDIFLRYGECKRVLFVAMGRLIYKRPPDITDSQRRRSLFSNFDEPHEDSMSYKTTSHAPCIEAGTASGDVKSFFLPSTSTLGRSSGWTSHSNIGISGEYTSTTTTMRVSRASTRGSHPTSKMESEIIHINYSKTGSRGRRQRKTVQWSNQCEYGVWISEPAFWVQWKHWGQLSTESHVEMVVLDCKLFHELFAKHSGPFWHAMKAVAIFFADYAETEHQQGKAVTDINVDQNVIEGFAKRGLIFATRDHGELMTGHASDPRSFPT